MQGKQASKCKVLARGKAQSFTHARGAKMAEECLAASLEFSTLSSAGQRDGPGSGHQSKRFGLEQLMEYVREVLEQVCGQDELRVRHRCLQFMREKGSELRGRVQERLSLLKYLQESLKYRSFLEVEAQVVKEWRKNAFFFSLATLWGHCLLTHQFKDGQEFVTHYDRFRNFFANLSHFYFRNSLTILAAKGLDAHNLFFEETAHIVIGGLKEWKEIYAKLLELLQRKEKSEEYAEMNLDFDLRTLSVNPHYLRLNSPQNQLPQTTAAMTEFASEYRIHQKIALLKRIRTTFLSQITESSKRIALELKLGRVGQFEKDDILDCMIYCIVRGQIKGLDLSLEALQLLVGRDCGLLAKKGVDSYRADLMGAVQYLCEDHSSPLIKLPKNLLSTRLTLEQ